jgi:hypothetical protein
MTISNMRTKITFHRNENIDEVCDDPMYNEMLNGIITEKEVLDAIKG